MARITIEDLPPYEGLSQAEKEALFGAGPKQFRPQLEALEERLVLWVRRGVAFSINDSLRDWSTQASGITPAAVNVPLTPQPSGAVYQNHLRSAAADEYARLGKGTSWDVWQQAWQQEEKKEGQACALDPIHPGDAPDRITPGQVYAIHSTTPGGPEDAFGDRVLASLSAHAPLTGLPVQQTPWNAPRIGKPIPVDPVPPGVTLHQMPVVEGVSLDYYLGKQATAEDVGPAVGPTAVFRKALAEVAKTTNLADRISINPIDPLSFDVTLYRPGVGWVKQGVSMKDRWYTSFQAWSSNDIAPTAKGSYWAMVVERAYLQEMGVDWHDLKAAGWAQKYGASFQSYDNAMTVLTGQAKPGAAAPWVKTNNIQDKDLANLEQALAQHRAVTATTWQSPYQTTGALISPSVAQDPQVGVGQNFSVVGIIHDGDNVLVRVYDGGAPLGPFSLSNLQVLAKESGYFDIWNQRFTTASNPTAHPVRGTITLSWAEFKSFFEKVTTADQGDEHLTATLDSSGVLRLDLPPQMSACGDVKFGGVEHKGRFSLDGVDILSNGKLVSSVEARLISRIDVYTGTNVFYTGYKDIRLDGLTHAVDMNIYGKSPYIAPEHRRPEYVESSLAEEWKGVQGNFHDIG